MLKKRFFILISLLSSIFVLFLLWLSPYFLNTIELKAYDTKMRLKRSLKPASDIVIVAVDEKSINEIGRWPWERSIIAHLIQELAHYGSKLIVLDMVFSEPTTEDETLAQAFKEAKNVILGYFFRPEATVQPSKEALDAFKKNAIKKVIFSANANPLFVPHFDWVEVNLALFQKHALSAGSVNILPDKDGVVRRAHLIFYFDKQFYPSLAFTSVIHKVGQNPILEIASFGVSALHLSESIPVDETGALWINFYHPQSFPYFSAVDVLNKRIKPELLKGKIVFVGVTEIGLADFRATPIHPVFPGIEINATIVSNLLKKHFLIRNNFTVAGDIFFILFWSLLLGFLLTKTKKTWQSLSFFSFLVIVHASLNYFLFCKLGLILSFIYPFLPLFLTYFFCEAYRNLIIERRQRYLKKAFSSYVAPELVEKIIEHPEQLRLGGEKKEVTILFSDIRGFTTISETLSPENLVSFLNEFLGPMTECIMAKGGTLDKFIGDAIMAIFNAPIDIIDHPYYACLSALEMLNCLRKLNEDWRLKGFPTINIGIGINTGIAIVGNMGAKVRFNYTAIGDTVNLASRLEGLNKIYGTSIIVSETTAKAVENRLMLRELDLVRVKGKKRPVTIFELMEREEIKLKEKFEEALILYRSKKFNEALILFKDINEIFPQDYPTLIYINRCKTYLENPPSPDWDGVFDVKIK